MDAEKCFHKRKTIEKLLTEMSNVNSGRAEEDFIKMLVDTLQGKRGISSVASPERTKV